MKLPSNKASFLILFIVILATTAFVLSDYFGKEEPAVVVADDSETIIVESMLGDYATRDSDGDGLLDWEEDLWGTDKYNPDTDGDGTSDYDEIQQGRDPLVPGPDDEDISPEEKIIKEIQERSTLDESGLTNKVAINFIDNYFKLREDGEFSQSDKELLINELVNNTSQEIEFKTAYSISSIRTFDSRAEKEKLVDYTESYLGGLVSILNQVSVGVSTLDNTIIGNNLIQEASKLTLFAVPKEIQQTHLNLVNNIHLLGQIIKGFDKEDTDPVYVLLLLPKYEESQTDLANINNQIIYFLQENDIIVDDDGIRLEHE